jgi:hypothetical protein
MVIECDGIRSGALKRFGKQAFASMVMKLLVVALLQDRALVHPVMVCLDCLGPFGF